MSSKFSVGKLPRRRVWLPYLVLIASLLLTSAIIFFVENNNEIESRHEFEVAAEETKLTILTRLESYRALLRGASGLFSANDAVSRGQFEAYVARQKIPIYYPGVQGVGYTVRIKPQEKERLVASMQRQGFSKFQIWPAGDRPDYYPVVYLEPRRPGNEPAIGFDMFSDPNRRSAMERARDEGSETASRKVSLVHEMGDATQAGFLIYVPVYRGGTPQTVADRRAALQGFVCSAFRGENLLAGILSQTRPTPLRLEVYDGLELQPENLLHRAGPLEPNPNHPPRFHKRSTIEVAGRAWTLAFYSLPEAPSPSEKTLVASIAVGGVLISLVLFYFTQAEGQARSAAERTSAELKESDAALRESEQRLSAIFNQATAGIAQTDIGGRFVLVNKKYCDIVGRPMSEVLGRRMQDFTHPEDLPANLELFKRMAAGGPNFTIEKRYLRPDGSYVWVNNSVSLLTDSVGKPSYVVAISQDITDRKRAEEEVRRLNTDLETRVLERTAQLEASNQELEAFSYSVSHDLRAPLRSIEGFNQALWEECKDNLNERGKEYLQRARGASRRMARLIDDMLHLSRLSRSEMVRQRLNLSELAESIASELHKSDPERLVDFVIAPNLPATGDERLLRIALENLLGNAWKFTSKRLHGRIELGLQERASKGKAAYFVRDNGAGFDMTYANKLFGVFQRLHTSSEFPGMGIGLATVQRIIHRHGGQIWALGETDTGATFYFTLPT